ncbi:MAG: hypothetical protein VKJ06_05710 [Vampirovibrionales bacterium]|nr:hypothetical protein [Vampirovibrionales bacterium]
MLAIATSITLSSRLWEPLFAFVSTVIYLLMQRKPGLRQLLLRRRAASMSTQAAYETLTVWDDAPTMLKFRNTGLHAWAMRITPLLLREARTARWKCDTVPEWPEAEQHLAQTEPFYGETGGLFARLKQVFKP